MKSDPRGCEGSKARKTLQIWRQNRSAKQCLRNTVSQRHMSTWLKKMVCARRDDVLGLRFDPDVRDGCQNSQHAEHSRGPCQGEFTKNQQQKRQQQKQQQQADIEQETNEMFVMQYRKVERHFEMFADIIEKNDGHTEFLEREFQEDSTNQTVQQFEVW